MTSPDQSTNTDSQELIQINLTWGSEQHLETVHINQLKLVFSGAEFYLTFGELVPPLLNQQDLPTSIEVLPRVRLAISPAAMKGMAEVIFNETRRFIKEDE